jgi:hypothetical protein
MPNILPSLKQPKVYIPLVIFLLVYVGLNVFVYVNRSKLYKYSDPSAPPAPVTPTPTPSFLASGRITYTISTGGKSPKITSLTLDDHNPKNGSVQKLEVTTSYSQPVDSVSIKITSDNKERVIDLVKKPMDVNVWQGSWQLDDSILYKDIYTITAVSGQEKSSVVTAPRS